MAKIKIQPYFKNKDTTIRPRVFKDLMHFKRFIFITFFPTYNELLEEDYYTNLKSINKLIDGATADNMQFREIKENE